MSSSSVAKRWKSVLGRRNRTCQGWRVWRSVLPPSRLQGCRVRVLGWTCKTREEDCLEKTQEAGNQECDAQNLFLEGLASFTSYT